MIVSPMCTCVECTLSVLIKIHTCTHLLLFCFRLAWLSFAFIFCFCPIVLAFVYVCSRCTQLYHQHHTFTLWFSVCFMSLSKQLTYKHDLFQHECSLLLFGFSYYYGSSSSFWPFRSLRVVTKLYFLFSRSLAPPPSPALLIPMLRLGYFGRFAVKQIVVVLLSSLCFFVSTITVASIHSIKQKF